LKNEDCAVTYFSAGCQMSRLERRLRSTDLSELYIWHGVL